MAVAHQILFFFDQQTFLVHQVLPPGELSLVRKHQGAILLQALPNL